MPKLSHVLAALMAEVTTARHMADEYTVSIAKRYRDDPLLRAMPVPRSRLSELVVDLPLLVENVSQPAGLPSADEAPADTPQAFFSAAEQTLHDLGKSPEQLKDAETAGDLPSLEVLVAADQLKAQTAAGGGNLVRLKLTLREEAMEWSTDSNGGERGGESVARLLPE